MTNRLAIILLALILGALAVDQGLGLGGTRFMARRLIDLIEWLAFWR